MKAYEIGDSQVFLHTSRSGTARKTIAFGTTQRNLSMTWRCYIWVIHKQKEGCLKMFWILFFLGNCNDHTAPCVFSEDLAAPCKPTVQYHFSFFVQLGKTCDRRAQLLSKTTKTSFRIGSWSWPSIIRRYIYCCISGLCVFSFRRRKLHNVNKGGHETFRSALWRTGQRCLGHSII